MGTSVAEYLGKRTDIDVPAIIPITIPPKVDKKVNWTEHNPCPTCPFTSGNACKKLVSGNEPVCSVRKTASDISTIYGDDKKIDFEKWFNSPYYPNVTW